MPGTTAALQLVQNSLCMNRSRQQLRIFCKKFWKGGGGGVERLEESLKIVPTAVSSIHSYRTLILISNMSENVLCFLIFLSFKSDRSYH